METRSGIRRRSRELRGAGASMAVAGLLLGCASSGPPEVTLDPMLVGEPSSALRPVAFISGCWLGESVGGGTVIEERWTPSTGQVMLGMTRFMRDGRVVGFEFHLLAAGEDAIALTPHPSGVRSEHSFTLTSDEPGAAVFEAPDHDYPKRILYTLQADGSLRISIDGGADDPEPRAWIAESVTCS